MPQHIPGKGVMHGNQSYYIICDNKKEVLNQEINKKYPCFNSLYGVFALHFYRNFPQVAKPLTHNFHLD